MATVRTNGIETFYERRGDGPPIVFVHSAAVDSRQWAPQLDALADEFTAIAYDVRGHGRTGVSDLQSYSINLFDDDLAALIEALALDRPILCGHSMGGCIAQAYAAGHADELGGLILADTFAPDILTRSEWLQRSLLMRATIPPT
ncbi:MAG: alpha/beta fold hydrolase [Halolamina sp.]